MEYEIRRAVPQDSREIGILRANNWREQYSRLRGVTHEWMTEQITRIAGSEGVRKRAGFISQAAQPNASNYWLVARLGDGTLAGYLEARVYDSGAQVLQSLHLAVGLRGKGVGQALINDGHEWFDASRPVYLDVADCNKDGQRFYLRPPNNYRFTSYKHLYGSILMRQMERRPRAL